MRKMRVVRNHSVMPSDSYIHFFCAKRRDIKTFHINDILSHVYGETLDFESLLRLYEESLQGRDNSLFSTAYILDEHHALRVDEKRDIILYHFQDSSPDSIPWDYPQTIAKIGSMNDETSDIEVINDLTESSALEFFLKYYFHKYQTTLGIEKKRDSFVIDGFLSVVIDQYDHIVFRWSDSYKQEQELYIADAWGETLEQVFTSLTGKSLLMFGKEYIGYWGR